MLVGPAPPADTREEMVEPPGIAPGSGPLITGAFIAIVRANPDRRNIGVPVHSSKGLTRQDARPRAAFEPIVRSGFRPGQTAFKAIVVETPPVQPWSVSRSLALLAAIFAIVMGALLPSAVAASPASGHPIQLCSGQRIFVVDDGSGGPVRQNPAPSDSLKCAACLAGAFVALAPPPPAQAPAAAPSPRRATHALPVSSTPFAAVRPSPRPPSTAPPVA